MIIDFRENTENFQYQIFPSAFKVAECPTYFCWKYFKYAETYWDAPYKNNLDKIKNHTFSIIIGMGSFIGGVIALPITLCLTPITLVADLIVGTVECIFCYYKGVEISDLKIIAHRKFIISPCQQITFCLGVIAVYGISILTLGPITLLTWTMGYAVGQIAVAKMPKSLNHEALNIFINGG